MKTIWSGEIELLAPTFCRGAYQDTPEIREPSIRGMVRWWFRKLGGTPDQEKSVFGGLKRFGQKTKGDVMASRVMFRADLLMGEKSKADTLPHKKGMQASPQMAFKEGGRFRLVVLSRLGGLSPELEKRLVQAIDVWILLGSLGLRANRAGGSLWPAGNSAPADAGELRSRLDTCGCHWPVYLAGPANGGQLGVLRAMATDTLNGMPGIFGSAKPRQASRLKIKLVRLEKKLRLLITAPDEQTITKARQALSNKPLACDTWQAV